MVLDLESDFHFTFAEQHFHQVGGNGRFQASGAPILLLRTPYQEAVGGYAPPARA